VGEVGEMGEVGAVGRNGLMNVGGGVHVRGHKSGSKGELDGEEKGLSVMLWLGKV
jgi:hypothetical protein